MLRNLYKSKDRPQHPQPQKRSITKSPRSSAASTMNSPASTAKSAVASAASRVASKPCSAMWSPSTAPPTAPPKAATAAAVPAATFPPVLQLSLVPCAEAGMVVPVALGTEVGFEDLVAGAWLGT